MQYRDIRIGQKVFLRGRLHGSAPAEVVGVDPRRIQSGDPVQVKVVLYPGDPPTIMWVGLDRLHLHQH